VLGIGLVVQTQPGVPADEASTSLSAWLVGCQAPQRNI